MNIYRVQIEAPTPGIVGSFDVEVWMIEAMCEQIAQDAIHQRVPMNRHARVKITEVHQSAATTHAYGWDDAPRFEERYSVPSPRAD